MKGAVAWFADNPVAANLLMLFILTACVGFGYVYGIVRYQYRTASIAA